MASRGPGAAKGRGTSRPGSRSSSARTDNAPSTRGGSAAAKATAGRSGTGRAATGKKPTSAPPGKSTTGKAPDKARPASRPAAGTRTPRGLAANARQQEGSGLWRWGVIALVGLVLVVLLAPTMRSYFAQRSEITALERQVAQGEERLRQLQAEEERWRDPAYIEQQARERLKFVRPGEVSYTVIGADEIEGTQVATGQVPESRPWYDRVWASIGQADRTDVEPVP